MHAFARRSLGALLALGALLLAGTPALSSSVVAQSASPSLSSTPAVVNETVALGTSRQVELTLRNESAAALTPRVYEAAVSGAASRQFAQPSAATRAGLPDQAQRIDPQIALDQAVASNGRADLLLFLADQADLAPAYALSNWAERGAYVQRTLAAHAERTQAPLRAALRSRGLAYRPLWIVNAVVVLDASAADVALLAGRAELAELRANRVAALEGVTTSATLTAPAALPLSDYPACAAAANSNVCWNIARVSADRAWSDFGIRGEGITVANIDSGVRFDHPALVGQYRGNQGGGSFDHNYNWYDLYGDSPAPVDSGNHGTHTMGTMVARGNTAAQPAVGVAPGARWIAARSCSARECSETDLILAAQWLLAPTDLAGANPRPELRPHVINNSWTAGQQANWYTGYVAAWRAAGIFPVFAAGNTGNATACGTIQSPGDYADVVAVGAVDSNDRLSSFSSIGPTVDGRVKPDLTAPGSGVFSTIADLNRLYNTNSGTSMATPHVAGAVALLWSANPRLIGDYDATYAALTGGATPFSGDTRYLDDLHAACRPQSIPNNIYGYGRLDTYAAVARAAVDVPWITLTSATLASVEPSASTPLRLTLDANRVPGPGTYQAQLLIHGPDLSQQPLVVPVTLNVPNDNSYATVRGVVRRADGTPTQATVRVAGGAEVATDAEGRYTLVLPPATQPYTLSALARSFLERAASVQLAPGQQVQLDFTLAADQPRLSTDETPRVVELAFAQSAQLRIPIRNEGSRPLSYTLSLPSDHYGVWRSDEPNGPPSTWSDPPSDAVLLSFGDDGVSKLLPIGFSFPYAGGVYEQFAISANGVISFEPLSEGLAFAKTCLPLPEVLGPAIVPLRLDLDPSQPGARISYATTAAGLLVSWENVALFNAETTRLSFQALLSPDGRISLRYRNVGTLPAAESATYGLQFGAREVQSLGCKGNLRLADGLTIELRPQTPASVWMRGSPLRGSIDPGLAAELIVDLNWVPPSAYGWPATGTLLLESNDPFKSRVQIVVRLQTGPAPYHTFFPRVAQARF